MMNKATSVFIGVLFIVALSIVLVAVQDIRYNTDKDCQCEVELQNWIWEGKEYYLQAFPYGVYIPYQGVNNYHLYNKFSELVCCRAYIQEDIVQWAVFLTDVSEVCVNF